MHINDPEWMDGWGELNRGEGGTLRYDSQLKRPPPQNHHRSRELGHRQNSRLAILALFGADAGSVGVGGKSTEDAEEGISASKYRRKEVPQNVVCCFGGLGMCVWCTKRARVWHCM